MSNPAHRNHILRGPEHWNQWRKDNRSIDIDLSGTDLAEMDFPNVNFSKVNLSETDLSGANLKGANFREANLTFAELVDANLSETDLELAKLFRIDLSFANLSKAKVKNSNITKSNLRETNFTSAQIFDTDFSGSNLKGANLSDANLRSVRFNNADLRNIIFGNINLKKTSLTNVDLRKTSLEGVDFSECYLSDTTFMDSDLTGANFNDAIILNCDFRCSNLTNANLSGATGSASVFANANLSNANLSHADLNGAIFNFANLNNANLKNTYLTDSKFVGAIIKGADLTNAILERGDLNRVVLSGSILRNTVLNRANLIDANFESVDLTGAFLWEVQKTGWKIKNIVCENVFWDREGKELVEYGQGDFERAYAEKPQIELQYKKGISPIELAMLPLIVEKLQDDYDGIELHIRSVNDEGSGAKVRIIVNDKFSRSDEEFQKEFTDIKERLHDRKNLLSEYKGHSKNLSNQIKSLQETIFLISHPEHQIKEMLTVLFLDLTGFSKKSAEDQLSSINFTRFSAQALLESFPGDPHLGKYANTWGDAIVVGFEDPNSGIEFSLKLIEILKIKNIEARIGMSFGECALVFNPTLRKLAPEGPAMSDAARLEPLAKRGEVLISKELRAHDLNEDLFQFQKTKRELKKAVGDLKAKAEISCHIVTNKKNSK